MLLFPVGPTISQPVTQQVGVAALSWQITLVTFTVNLTQENFLLWYGELKKLIQE